MSKARVLGTVGVAIAGIVGACGGKVVFVQEGAGGATTSSSVTSPSVTSSNAIAVTNVVSTGPCNSCECQPGGCTDAISATVSGVGGGPNGCTTCAEVISGQGNVPNCPQSITPFADLVKCLCDPSVCGASDCKDFCADLNSQASDACSMCATSAATNQCAMQFNVCAAN